MNDKEESNDGQLSAKCCSRDIRKRKGRVVPGTRNMNNSHKRTFDLHQNGFKMVYLSAKGPELTGCYPFEVKRLATYSDGSQ